jgi:hypothetical protein
MAIHGFSSYRLKYCFEPLDNVAAAVRARDDKGRWQPAERPSERLDLYESNAWQRINVIVT